MESKASDEDNDYNKCLFVFLNTSWHLNTLQNF